MLKHNLSEALAGLEEALNRALTCLSEYGVHIGSYRRPLSHPVNSITVAESSPSAQSQTSKALAVAAGVTLGLAAGMILVAFFVSRQRE